MLLAGRNQSSPPAISRAGAGGGSAAGCQLASRRRCGAGGAELLSELRALPAQGLVLISALLSLTNTRLPPMRLCHR